MQQDQPQGQKEQKCVIGAQTARGFNHNSKQALGSLYLGLDKEIHLDEEEDNLGVGDGGQ